MKFYKKILQLAMIVLTACTTVNKPDLPLENEDDSSIQNSLDTLLTDLRFESKVVDLGKVPSDTVVFATYNFENIGDYPLRINYVNPDCICTDYEYTKGEILSGNKGTINLIFDTKDKGGQQKLYAVVNANTSSKLYRLIMKMNVQQQLGN